MEGGIDSYLHKKFKKQLSIDAAKDLEKHRAPPQETDNNVPNASTNLQSSISSSSISAPPEEAPDRAQGKYVCNYCNLACSKPSVLQKHIRAHTNERPYPCVSCGFSFKTRSNLYKHCRSRTHANRVMGTRPPEDDPKPKEEIKLKPYKPRFHTTHIAKENIEEDEFEDKHSLSHHINEIISKNNSIINNDLHLRKKRIVETEEEEPLNLSNKNRKRCMSEVVAEPVVQKSLIKELLLKNLYSDSNMQCQYCKMIFQTVTELELHKLRSCKGKPSSAKYTRSSSVNVASILTQNKNAFDNIPQLQNVFPHSPGPFLGKTRLVDSDKSKSFSFEGGLSSEGGYFSFNQAEKGVKLFGGEVKVQNKEEVEEKRLEVESVKLSENRVVRSSLHSGGTVLTANKTKENKEDVIRVYENSAISPSIDMVNIKFSFEKEEEREGIMDFSQKAMKLLTPNIRRMGASPPNNNNCYNPVNLLVNGKVVRYVPGMPGPATAEEEPMDVAYGPRAEEVKKPLKLDEEVMKEREEVKKKFARPNSLALKPSTVSLKQHHGLTPTMFNKILISPDTPRVAKKYAQHFLHGNYFSYLGLKSSTKPVYCTLNKTQPFYVPHFKKLSMYSEWRQQETKTDKLFVGGYDSRQRQGRYTMAGKAVADLIIHSSYKFKVSEAAVDKQEKEQKGGSILGGYECNDDYTYIRGRGRGRYVCDQCGIRCKKPSMLKKHIRTHSNDRPYTCSHCNFSFKTKGNLTKHMKSKAHTKNYTASSGSSSSTQHSGTQSSDSDTEDSGMDSSDESLTRQQEHEAAYGLLSLSQKTGPSLSCPKEASDLMSTEEIAQVSKRNYAKNKILDQTSFTTSSLGEIPIGTAETKDSSDINQFLGKSNHRPLTYPYTNVLEERREEQPKSIKQFNVIQKYGGSSREQELVDTMRNVNLESKVPLDPPTLKVNGVAVEATDLRKRRYPLEDNDLRIKHSRSNEVMDLSLQAEKHRAMINNHKYVASWMAGVQPAEAEDLSVGYYNGLGKGGSLEYREEEVEVSQDSHKFEYDNSAMETLADIATKQDKLEKNTLAKSVASEFLKLATKSEMLPEGKAEVQGDVNVLIVKPEGNKSCTICSKSFNKPSQLRLHMNIHYLERPFRCDSCSVSFRTKGHLQKHERSAGHHNKLSSWPALPSSEPRPFKCTDCNIAFRIHGHLAKHLRSKMHIMKLECLAKIPFGLYAELERSNSLLTEINTCDGDQCLESLKNLAKKVFMNDPSKLSRLEVSVRVEAD